MSMNLRRPEINDLTDSSLLSPARAFGEGLKGLLVLHTFEGAAIITCNECWRFEGEKIR